MKSKKLIGAGTILAMFFASVHPLMAQCYVNEQEVPCDIFWAQYGWLFFICFLIPGLLLLAKPNWITKCQSWSAKKFMGAQFIPSRKTEMVLRLMGGAFIVLSLVFLYISVIH